MSILLLMLIAVLLLTALSSSSSSSEAASSGLPAGDLHRSLASANNPEVKKIRKARVSSSGIRKQKVDLVSESDPPLPDASAKKTAAKPVTALDSSAIRAGSGGVGDKAATVPATSKMTTSTIASVDKTKISSLEANKANKPHPKAGAAAAARADSNVPAENRKHGQGIVQPHKSTTKIAVRHQEPSPEQYKQHTQQHKQFFHYLRQHHCHHLYFELGHSFYLQTLYEQNDKTTEHQHVVDIFADIFRSKELPKQQICTLAFHHPALHTHSHGNYHKLQEYYQSLNYPLVVFTDTLVTTFNGYFTYESKASNRTDSNAVMFEAPRNDSLITVSIDALLHTIFTTWHASSSFHSNSSRVIANMVIDASDFDLLPDMVGHGFVCRFDHLLAEVVLNSQHNSTLAEDRVTRSRKKCNFQESSIKQQGSNVVSKTRNSKLVYFKNRHTV